MQRILCFPYDNAELVSKRLGGHVGISISALEVFVQKYAATEYLVVILSCNIHEIQMLRAPYIAHYLRSLTNLQGFTGVAHVLD